VDEAIALADRIIVLDRGVVVADIPTDLPEESIARLERSAEIQKALLAHLGVGKEAGTGAAGVASSPV
jgi:ABC-type nitrate/sulfonate/bicarbonate transport system ATPase subunit